MFRKLIAPEPLDLPPEIMARFTHYADEFKVYDNIPSTENETLKRIFDADGILLKLHTHLPEHILRQCRNLRYIGLCCTLYEDDSCTCHLPTVRDMGIVITGVMHYGDKGVPEFVISQLTDFLHGFNDKIWKKDPYELSGVRISVLGLGSTGTLVAKALKYFEADVSYYDRSEKKFAAELGIPYMPLPEILKTREIICTCLNKNITLLTEEELQKWTGNKILVNTSLSPSFAMDYIETWLDNGNYLFCDSLMALGDKRLLIHPHVTCAEKFSGGSYQSNIRLGEGVIRNMEMFLNSVS